MAGFFGTGATYAADLNLVIQVVMGLALLVGMGLARRKHFRAHMYCQASVMLLNLVLIGLIMLPSFRKQVSPQIPEALRDTFYALATVHAGLGTLAELLGLYIVLVAATNLVPRRLRFERFKVWMRTELSLWWLVILFGVGTYVRWYVFEPRTVDAGTSTNAATVTIVSPTLAAVPVPRPSAPSVIASPVPAASAQTASAVPSTAPTVAEANRAPQQIGVSNFQFAPKALSVLPGTTVEWLDQAGRHTVNADNGTFSSGPMVAGGRFSFTFDSPGSYAYFCEFHGDQGGQGMSGVVVVEAAAP